jgi:hypothetical protein
MEEKLQDLKTAVQRIDWPTNEELGLLPNPPLCNFCCSVGGGGNTTCPPDK